MLFAGVMPWPERCHDRPIAFAVAALVAVLAYCVGFLLLAVVTRHAVVIGLIYALSVGAWSAITCPVPAR